MINVYCETAELFSLFLFEQIKVNDRNNVGTILFRDGTEVEFERHDFGHINEVVHEVKTKKNGVVVFEDLVKHPNLSIFNPKPNSLIIFDRWWIDRNFTFMKDYLGIDWMNKLFDRWKERNVRVLFNFAFYESLLYETMMYDFITFDFPFKHLKLTDYPLFKDMKDFKYDKLYSMFHYISKNFNHLYADNGSMDNINSPIDKVRNNIPCKPHSIKKDYLFQCLQMTPRPHRVYFIEKLIENNLKEYGVVTMNEESYKEYIVSTNSGNFIWDNNCNQNEFAFYKSEFLSLDKWEFLKSEVVTESMGENRFENHTFVYDDRLEFDRTYIDIYGETHVLYNTMFPTFTEKGTQPIMFEKMFILYGGNEFYRCLEKIGVDPYLDELMLPKDYITIESPYEQVDLIIESLKKLSKVDFSKVVIESKDKILNNKEMLLKYYDKIISEIYNFILVEN
jgi:hypothetical protein